MGRKGVLRIRVSSILRADITVMFSLEQIRWQYLMDE